MGLYLYEFFFVNFEINTKAMLFNGKRVGSSGSSTRGEGLGNFDAFVHVEAVGIK